MATVSTHSNFYHLEECQIAHGFKLRVLAANKEINRDMKSTVSLSAHKGDSWSTRPRGEETPAQTYGSHLMFEIEI